MNRRFSSLKPTPLRLAFTLLVSCALAVGKAVPVVEAQIPQKSGDEIRRAEETKNIKERIVKIGREKDVTIVRRDGREFYGRIESTEDDRVSIYEVDLKAKVEINFDQIKKVSKGSTQLSLQDKMKSNDTSMASRLLAGISTKGRELSIAGDELFAKPLSHPKCQDHARSTLQA